MIRRIVKIGSFYFLSFVHCIFAENHLVNPSPVDVIPNSGASYSLINSVEYHPTENLFCVTYTHNNKVGIYKLDEFGKAQLVQNISNPEAKLVHPQHASFSKDGESLWVVNWTSETLGVYLRNNDGTYHSNPSALIKLPSSLIGFKPHGISFSPCGKYLAIAFGFISNHPKGIAIFEVSENHLNANLVHLLKNVEDVPGIPKGITFSPDGNYVLVTFSDLNSIYIYPFDKVTKRISTSFWQIIEGVETKISRPEDIKITSDGNYCVISNSELHTITFYPFDKTANRITQNIPYETLENPEAGFYFPHGIAFSNDGQYMLVTQFGKIKTCEKGGVAWVIETKAEESKFSIYKMIDGKTSLH